MNRGNPQEEFDTKYISSGEIVRRLEISRVTLFNARKSGIIPDPITLASGNCYLWLRSELEPILRTWQARINAKRNGVEVVHG